MRLFFLRACFVSARSPTRPVCPVDFTQNPTAFDIESNWDLFNPFGTGFIGEFLPSNAHDRHRYVAIVDENTGELLDTLDLSFTSGGNDGTAGRRDSSAEAWCRVSIRARRQQDP